MDNKRVISYKERSRFTNWYLTFIFANIPKPIMLILKIKIVRLEKGI